MASVMKAKVLIPVLVVVGALLAVVGVQQSTIGKLREQIVASGDQADPASTARAGMNQGTRVIPGKSADKRVARSDARDSESSPSPDGPTSDAELGESLRKMVDNPAGRAMMNQGIKAMSSMWYADLIEDFGLDKKESDYFLSLVAGSMSAQQNIGMKMMSATAEEREALAEEISTAKKDSEDAIKEFLNNDEDYASYEAYQERLPERQQIDGLRAVMSEADAPLTPEQEDKVIEAMFQARTSNANATDWNGSGGMEAIASGDAVEKFEADWNKSARKTADEVGKFLEEPQLEAFKSYQTQMKDMQLMGIKMAAKMFKTDDDDTP
jgi:hypothetical protein